MGELRAPPGMTAIAWASHIDGCESLMVKRQKGFLQSFGTMGTCGMGLKEKAIETLHALDGRRQPHKASV